MELMEVWGWPPLQVRHLTRDVTYLRCVERCARKAGPPASSTCFFASHLRSTIGRWLETISEDALMERVRALPPHEREHLLPYLLGVGNRACLIHALRYEREPKLCRVEMGPPPFRLALFATYIQASCAPELWMSWFLSITAVCPSLDSAFAEVQTTLQDTEFMECMDPSELMERVDATLDAVHAHPEFTEDARMCALHARVRVLLESCPRKRPRLLGNK